MKTKTLLTVAVLFLVISTFGQKTVLDLTFTGINNYTNVQIENIKIINRTQGVDTVLYWPDTVLVLGAHVGTDEVNYQNEGFQVFQNYPNPAINQTNITIYIPEKGNVNLVITDILGCQVIRLDRILEKGYHSYIYTPGRGEIFFFTAYWKENNSSIKILNTGNNSGITSSLEYAGTKSKESKLKKTEAA